MRGKPLDRSKRLSTIGLTAVVAGLMMLLGGCGGSGGLQQLSGSVTLVDGSPLVGARLVFRSGEAGNFSAWTDTNGDYTASSTDGTEGIAPGTYGVTVMEEPGDIDNPMRPKIATKYNLARNSGLQVTVPTEGDTFDIVLEPWRSRRSKKRK